MSHTTDTQMTGGRINERLNNKMPLGRSLRDQLQEKTKQSSGPASSSYRENQARMAKRHLQDHTANQQQWKGQNPGPLLPSLLPPACHGVLSFFKERNEREKKGLFEEDELRGGLRDQEEANSAFRWGEAHREEDF